MRLGLAPALLIALVVTSAQADDAVLVKTRPLSIPDSAAPTFSVYNTRDGLSDEIWSTVGVDSDGFVWAGSASTLARFDGYRWTMMPLPQARSLVRDMASDSAGNLWAIFEREGLARYDGSRWQLVGAPRFYQRFSTIPTTNLPKDVSGDKFELWSAHEQGLVRLVGGQWIEDTDNPTDLPGHGIAVARTQTLLGAPREWIATSENGLWSRQLLPTPGPWQRFEQPGVRDMPMTDLHRSNDGQHEELWAISYGSGIARIRDDGVRIWRSETGELPTEAMYSIVETRDSGGARVLWVATRAGLLRMRDGEHFDVFNRRNGLPADAVRGVKVQHGSDGTDSLWVATEGGIARTTLSDSPWHTVSLLGATENGTFGVLLEPNARGGQRLWVGSAKEGLDMLDDGQWRHFNQATGDLPTNSVRGIWRLPGPDGRNHRLLGLIGAPLQEIGDDLIVRPLPTPWPVTKDAVVTTMVARNVDGAVEWWAGVSPGGVYRLRNGEWTGYPTLGGPETSPLKWLTHQVDHQGHAWLWAADSLGIARFNGISWERLPASLGLPADGFRSLLVFTEEGKQVLWASSSHHGILRLDVTDAAHPRLLDNGGLPAPPDPTVYSVLRDSLGRLYVCTNNGVQQLTPKPGGGYNERVFQRRNGLVHDECNTNSQFIDDSDRYWVGTLGGLSMFDPSTQVAARATVSKPLYFTAMHVDGNPWPIPAKGQLSLPAGSHELRIDYTLLTGQREGESRYRTQLIGLDASPSAWTSEHGRSFGALPPGDYRLRVEARDFSANLAVPKEFAFTVPPLWWQQTWLRVAGGVAFALLALGGMLAYNRGLRSREKLLRRQVAERTEDLHSANLRLTELSYLDPLTGVANRRRLLEAMATAMERAVAQHKPLGLIVADVDHFKLYNDRHGHLAGDAALRAIAGAMNSAMREQDLVARFGGEEFACLMIDADIATVTRVAERMRALVEALPPRSLGNDDQTLTISAGVLSCVPSAGQAPEELLHAADQALYDAKASGRNQVMTAATR